MIVILVFYDTEYHVADDIKLDCMLFRILKKYLTMYRSSCCAVFTRILVLRESALRKANFFLVFSCWRFLAQYFFWFFPAGDFKLNIFSGVFLSGLLIQEMYSNLNVTTQILIHPQHCAINK